MITTCICTTLRQVASASTAFYDAALAPSGLKVTMFRLLRQIQLAGDVSISELAGIVGLDRSTLGRNLRVLEKQSLIRLQKGADGRARQITLTPQGRAALCAAEPLWEEAQTAFAARLGSDSAMVLSRLAALAQPGAAAPGQPS